MKIIIVTIVAALIIAGCSRQKTTENTPINDSIAESVVEDEVMTGAYSEEREPTEEELALFESTYKGEVKLTPCSVSTQVVAGTNYAFCCKDGEGIAYMVRIFVPLPCNQDTQTTEVTCVEKVK